jgi:hypothetical protein
VQGHANSKKKGVDDSFLERQKRISANRYVYSAAAAALKVQSLPSSTSLPLALGPSFTYYNKYI